MLREVLGLPTAPYHEGHVAAYIRRFASDRGWTCDIDAAGNLAVRYRHGVGGDTVTPLVFEAHLDHPGFHVDAVDGSAVAMSFLGKAPAVDLVGARLQMYAVPVGGASEPVPVGGGTVKRVHKSDAFYRPLSVEVELDAPATDVRPGGFAVFDLPTWSLAPGGHRLGARAHDDLAQVAAVLVLLDRLHRERPAADVTALFTRAEEVGFVGARAAAEAGTLPDGAVVIVLECSGLPAERGFVVRAGDFTSMYDGWATTRLMQLADARAAADPDFLYQTPIPRRGTCNASLYAALGFRAAGLTLPMQNYHNQGPDGPAAEIIDLRDWITLADFLFTVATDFGDYDDIQRRIRAKMDGIWKAERGHLERGG